MNTSRRQYTIIRNPQRRLRVLRAAARYLIDDAGITAENVTKVTTRLARRGLAASDSRVSDYAWSVRAAEGLDEGWIPVEDYLGGARYYVPAESLREVVADEQRDEARALERAIAGA